MLRIEPDKPTLLGKDNRKMLLADKTMADLLYLIISRGASARFKAKGFSMHPFIRDGDVIVISPVSGTILECGHIVAFLHPSGGKLCVHRIVKRTGDGFIIRGDNLSVADGLIPNENILGMVTGVERNEKKVLFGHGPEKKLIARFWHMHSVRNAIELARKIVRLKRKLPQL